MPIYVWSLNWYKQFKQYNKYQKHKAKTSSSGFFLFNFYMFAFADDVKWLLKINSCSILYLAHLLGQREADQLKSDLEPIRDRSIRKITRIYRDIQLNTVK